MDSCEQVLQLFSGMRTNDTATEKQAENGLLDFMRRPECVPSFLNIIVNCQDEVVIGWTVVDIPVESPDGRFVYAKSDNSVLEFVWREYTGIGLAIVNFGNF